jgi:toxin ParE1/3/4
LKLRVIAPALADIEEILAYLRGKSPASADRVGRRIEAVMNSLTANPDLARRTNRKGIRYINTYPYPYLISFAGPLRM